MVLLILSIATVFVSVALFNTTFSAIMLVILLFAFPIYASLSGKTWFSFSTLDPRVLRLERNLLQVGEEVFPLSRIENISMYVHSFYGFRFGQGYRPSAGISGAEFGDKNRISFFVAGKEYSFRFILRSGLAYVILYKLMAHWKASGVEIHLREKYSYDFVVRMIVDTSNRVP
jgi:hypothetical protein